MSLFDKSDGGSGQASLRMIHLLRQPTGRPTPYAALFQHVHPLVIGTVDRSGALSTRLRAEFLDTTCGTARRPARSATR